MTKAEFQQRMQLLAKAIKARRPRITPDEAIELFEAIERVVVRNGARFFDTVEQEIDAIVTEALAEIEGKRAKVNAEFVA